jgi:hypothetical protein
MRDLIPGESKDTLGGLDVANALKSRSVFEYRRMAALDEVVGSEKRFERVSRLQRRHRSIR